MRPDLRVSKRSDASLSGTDQENAEFVPVDPKRSTSREGEDWKIEKASLMVWTFHQVKEKFYIWKIELRLESSAACEREAAGLLES